MRQNYDPPVVCVCQFCQKSFTFPACWVRRGGGKFCSYDCKYAADRIEISVVCEMCQTSFMTIPAYQRKGPVRFCSRACYDQSRALSLEARFWQKVLKTEKCWPWQGGYHKSGYGLILSKGKGTPKLLAHRVAWEIGCGPIPEGFHVLHHCDNPPCVNYEECLFLGTTADNNADMIAKGRAYWQKQRALLRAS